MSDKNKEPQKEKKGLPRRMRIIGSFMLIISCMIYPLQLIWVNIFQPEIITNSLFLTPDPISTFGFYVMLFGAPASFMLISAGSLFSEMSDRGEEATSKMIFKGLGNTFIIIMNVISLPLTMILIVLVNGLLRN